MKYLCLGSVLVVLVLSPRVSRAQSLWDRRDPNTAYLFKDMRARKVGDVITVAVYEATLFDGKENRDLKKDVTRSKALNLTGALSAGQSSGGTSFTGNFAGSGAASRELSGTADYKSDRTFTDRMSVTVVAVLPNGNLIIEGSRERIVQHEKKMLTIKGIVRPTDIGPDNVVESQFIANFVITYMGNGTESSHIDYGWIERVVHQWLPF